MAVRNILKQNSTILRVGSALGLAALALRSFAKGKRLRGLAAAGGAVAVGATASTLEPTPVEIEAVEEADGEAGVEASEPTTEASGLRCGVCEEAIVTGESRRPNDNDDIVHEACL